MSPGYASGSDWPVLLLPVNMATSPSSQIIEKIINNNNQISAKLDEPQAADLTTPAAGGHRSRGHGVTAALAQQHQYFIYKYLK